MQRCGRAAATMLRAARGPRQRRRCTPHPIPDRKHPAGTTAIGGSTATAGTVPSPDPARNPSSSREDSPAWTRGAHRRRCDRPGATRDRVSTQNRVCVMDVGNRPIVRRRGRPGIAAPSEPAGAGETAHAPDGKDGGPCRARTYDQGIMRTTSAFAARFRFVVWTLSCLSAFPSSLYTFSLAGASLGVGVAALPR